MIMRKNIVNLLIVVMLLCFVSAFENSVFAVDDNSNSERSITIGTSHIEGKQKSNIYYGRYPQNSLGTTKPENSIEGIDYIKNDAAVYNNQGPYYSIDPVKWRVLSISNDTALLFVDKILESKSFNETYGYIYWDNCTIRSWLNGYDASSNECGIDYTNNNFINSVFSLSEIGFMKKSYVDGVNDCFYLLSYSDANNANYGFVENADRIVKFTDYHLGKYKYGASWWLRTWSSVGYPCDRFYVSADTGVFPSPNLASVKGGLGICPAFKISLEPVLFTSGTDSGYALTFKEETRAFSIKDTSAKQAYTGDKISFEYENSETGSNEYISAIVADADNKVLCYSQLETAETESGDVTFDVPQDLEPGEYTLKLFNEQYNGEKLTSYSSDFVNVPLTVENKPEFEILSCSTVENKAVSTISIPQIGSYKIVFADYESGKLNDINIVTITVTEATMGEVTQDSSKEMVPGAGDKIMLWNDTADIMPMCNVFTVE